MSPGISSEQYHRKDSQDHPGNMEGHSSLYIWGVFSGCSNLGPVVVVGGCMVMALDGPVNEWGAKSKGVEEGFEFEIVVGLEGGGFLSAAAGYTVAYWVVEVGCIVVG